MTKSEQMFNLIADELPNTKKGKMFGALSISAQNGKAGVMLWKEDMIFKLDGDDLKQALDLDGASMFDPMGGRPMKGWVQVPNIHSDKWIKLARISMVLVEKLEKKPTKKKKIN